MARAAGLAVVVMPAPESNRRYLPRHLDWGGASPRTASMACGHSGANGQPLRKVGEDGGLALGWPQSAACHDAGDGLEQRLGIGVARATDRTAAPGPTRRCMPAYMTAICWQTRRATRQVVRDEDHRQLVPRSQLVEEPQDTHLGGHVEAVVGSSAMRTLRRLRQRDRDRYALSHPAAELVWVCLQTLTGVDHAE